MSDRFRWVCSERLRHRLKHDPAVALWRQKTADGYRKMRKDNPALARLVYRRQKAAEREFAHLLYGGPSSPEASQMLRDLDGLEQEIMHRALRRSGKVISDPVC